MIYYVLPVLWMTSFLHVSQGCLTLPPTDNLGHGYKQRVGILVAGDGISSCSQSLLGHSEHVEYSLCDVCTGDVNKTRESRIFFLDPGKGIS